MPTDKDRAGQDRYDQDLIAGDSPVLSLPVEERQKLRSHLEGILDEEELDVIYGPDSKEKKK